MDIELSNGFRYVAIVVQKRFEQMSIARAPLFVELDKLLHAIRNDSVNRRSLFASSDKVIDDIVLESIRLR